MGLLRTKELGRDSFPRNTATFCGAGRVLGAERATGEELMGNEARFGADPLGEGELRTITEELGVTAREHEVVRCLLDGQSDEEIARSLGMARSTLRTHLSRVFRKFGATSRARVVGIVVNTWRTVQVDSRQQ